MQRLEPTDGRGTEVVFNGPGLAFAYGPSLALRDVPCETSKNYVTAFIGPSGCGKSTFIRCFNRMNDLVPGAVVGGEILYHGPTSTAGVDPVEVRRRIGMVFQKPNPFPKSIYDNIAFGPRVLGMKKDMDERVERSLRQAALWDEVKDRLKECARSLGRPAAAALHRAGHRRRAGRDPDGRAARPSTRSRRRASRT